MTGMTPEMLRRKTRPMRTPEEVALSFTGECERAGLGLCANHRSPLGAAKTCLHVLHLTEIIHEREVEVRADERAKVMDGFEHDAAVAAKALRETAPRFRHDRPSASVWAEMLDLADQIEAGESGADA